VKRRRTPNLALVGPKDRVVTLDELLGLIDGRGLREVAEELGTSAATLSRFLIANGYRARRSTHYVASRTEGAQS